jgi:MFS family permease
MIAALRNRDYRLIWLALVASALGDELRTWAIVYWVFTATGRAPIMQAMVLAAELVPAILIGPLAGTWADGSDRKRLMIRSDLVRGVLSLSLIAAIVAGRPPAVLVLLTLSATAAQLFLPASGALTCLLLSPEEMIAAGALSKATRTLISLIGPLLGVLVYRQAGPRVAFAIDAGSFFVSALLLLRLRDPSAHTRARGQLFSSWRSFWRAFADGLVFIRDNDVARALFLTISAMSLGIGALNALGIILVTREMGLGEEYVAWSSTAQAVGTLGGAILTGSFTRRVRAQYRVLFVGVELLAIGVWAVAAAPNVGILFAGRFVLGGGAAVVTVSMTSLFQSAVPEELLGRVGATLENLPTIIMLGSIALAGWLAAALSTRVILAAAGLLLAASGAVALSTLARSAPRGATSCETAKERSRSASTLMERP